MKHDLCRIHVPIFGTSQRQAIDLTSLCKSGSMAETLEGILLIGLTIEAPAARRLVTAETARLLGDPAWLVGLLHDELAMIRLYSNVEIDGVLWEQAFDAHGSPLGALSDAGFLDSSGRSYRSK